MRKKRRIIEYPNVDATLMLNWKNWYLYWLADNKEIQSLANKLNVDSLIYEKQRKKWFYVARSYKYYMYDKDNNVVFFPKWAYQHMEKKYYYSKHWDIWKKIDVKFNGKLFDWQQKIVDDATIENSWLIQAPTGSWKSYIIQWLIDKIKTKTIVLSPSVEIARWLYDKFTGDGGLKWCTVWMMWWGSKTTGDVIIMVSDTFSLRWKELSWEYPMLIIDEAHEEFTSNKRIEQLCLYQCDYLYWLTATPEREEVPTEAFDLVFGKRHIAVKEVMKPQIAVYKYDNPKIYPLDWQDKIRTIFADKERTEKQADIVKSAMLCNRNMWLVLVSQKDVAEELTEAINRQWVYAESYTWDTNVKIRKEVLKRIHEKKGVMVATYQTVWTWFDYPQLDTCFYYCPVKFQWRVKQAVWRILRECETKSFPLLVEWIDRELQYQWFQRMKLYKSFFGVIPIDYNLFVWLQYLRDDRLPNAKE